MDRCSHWERVYETTAADQVSWYASHLSVSLEWIVEAAPGRSASIIDVGGGASTLVEDLYALGYRALTVLDLSGQALALSRERLGAAAREVQWIVGDVAKAALPQAAFDVWHDRAVFHFLTESGDREAYRERLARALKPGGQVVMATFSTNGPRRCSGLPVCRYDAASIAEEFGPGFRLVKSATVLHRTPANAVQEFLYARLERKGGGNG